LGWTGSLLFKERTTLSRGLTLTDGPIDLDPADGFPRFFFSSREVDEHTRTFLKWRHWNERTFPHALEAA
jgi:hypothetical protein